jgi:hypothetical protein
MHDGHELKLKKENAMKIKTHVKGGIYNAGGYVRVGGGCRGA